MQSFVSWLFASPLVLMIIAYVLYMMVPSAANAGKFRRAKVFAGVSFALFMLLLASSIVRIAPPNTPRDFVWAGIGILINGFMALSVYRQFIVRLFR